MFNVFAHDTPGYFYNNDLDELYGPLKLLGRHGFGTRLYITSGVSDIDFDLFEPTQALDVSKFVL